MSPGLDVDVIGSKLGTSTLKGKSHRGKVIAFRILKNLPTKEH